MPQLFLNNCYGVLDTPATASDTTLVLTQMHGFPDTMGETDWFTLTVFADSSRYGVNIEVVKVTGIDDTLLTVERGYEGDAVAHGAGERVEARLTADAMQRLRDLASLPSWEIGDVRTVVKHAELSDDWAPLDGRVVDLMDAPGLADIGGVYREYSPTLRTFTTGMVDELGTGFTTVGYLKGYMYETARGGELVIRDVANGYQEVNRFTAAGSSVLTGTVSEAGGKIFFSSGNIDAPIMWSDDGVNFNEGPTIDGGVYIGPVFYEQPGGDYLIGAYSPAGVQVVELPGALSAGVATPTAVHTAPTTNNALLALTSPALDGRYLVLPTEGDGTELLDLQSLASYPVTPIDGTLITVCDLGAIYAATDFGIKVVGVTTAHEIETRLSVPFENFGRAVYKQPYCSQLPDTSFIGTRTDTGYNAFVLKRSNPSDITPISHGDSDSPQRFIGAAAYQGRALVHGTISTSDQFLYLDEIYKASAPLTTRPAGFSQFGVADFGLVPETLTGASQGRTPIAYVDTENGEFAWCKIDDDAGDLFVVVERNAGGEWVERGNIQISGPSAGAFRPKGLAFLEKGHIAYCGPVPYTDHEFGVLYDNTEDSAAVAMEYSNATLPPPTDITALMPSADGFPPLALHSNGDVTFVYINSGSKLSHDTVVSPTNTQSEYRARLRVGRAPLPWPDGADPSKIEYVSGIVTRSSRDDDDAYITLLAKEEGALYVFRLAGIDKMSLLHTVKLMDLTAATERYNKSMGASYSWAPDFFWPSVIAEGDKFVHVFGGTVFLYDIRTQSIEFAHEDNSNLRPYHLSPINGVYFYYGNGKGGSINAKTGELTEWDAGDFYYTSRSSTPWMTWRLPDDRLACIFSESMPSGVSGSVYALTPIEATETQMPFDPATQFYLPNVPTGSDHLLNYVKIR